VQQSTTKMGSAFGTLATQIKSLAPAVSAAAFLGFSKQAIDAAGRMVDLAQQIGFTTQALIGLEIPLVKSGSNLEQFASAINLMNANIGQAAHDIDGNLAQAFNRLGIDVQRLLELSPEEQFYTIANALSQVGTQFEQTEIGRAIFGRGFASLIPLIKEANGEMEKTAGAVGDLDKSMSDAFKTVDDFGDSLSAAAISARNEFVALLAVIINIINAIGKIVPPADSRFAGAFNTAKIGTPLPGTLRGTVSNRNPGHFSGELYGPFYAGGEMQGPNMPQRQRGGSSGSPSQNIERAAKAAEDYNSHIEEYNRVMADAKRQSEAFTESIKNNLSQGLTQAVFAADSAGDAFSRMAMQIAQAIFERSVSQPLSNSIVDAIDGSSIFNGLSSMFGGFFAEGGNPPVGRPSIVGENGPEMFVPRVPGTVIPNGAGIGGQSVTVQQYFQVSNDVPSLIEAHIRNAAPVIAKAAHEAVFSSIRRGGSASKIVGLRG